MIVYVHHAEVNIPPLREPRRDGTDDGSQPMNLRTAFRDRPAD